MAPSRAVESDGFLVIRIPTKQIAGARQMNTFRNHWIACHSKIANAAMRS